MKRIIPKYMNKVSVPVSVQALLWDEKGRKAPLEKLILRILTYGRFKEVRWVYGRHPSETFEMLSRYPEIKRGVKFWIEHWHAKKTH